MSDQATEQLALATSVDAANDLLVLKENGAATLKAVAPKDCYFAALEPVAFILRVTGGSPNTIAFIDEGYVNEHKKYNAVSVSMDGDKISVTFGKEFARIGSIVANGDDALAGVRFFGCEATTTGVDIYVADKNGNAINPLTDIAITAANNAIWVLGMMWPAV
jgi:hypothetical protein